MLLLEGGEDRTDELTTTEGVRDAADGGIDIPHSEKRFPGYDREANDKKGAYDAGVHAERIFGEHVANYMEELDEEGQQEL